MNLKNLGLETVIEELMQYMCNHPGSVFEYAKKIGIHPMTLDRILAGNKPRTLKTYLQIRKFLTDQASLKDKDHGKMSSREPLA